jgi:NTE family protein
MQTQQGSVSTASLALVLGGGGPLGIAWETGMLQGWADAWAAANASAAPLGPVLNGRIIGTSAGAIVGAHLAIHGSVSALWVQQQEPPGRDAPNGPKMTGFMAAFLKAKLLTRDVTKFRRSMGRSARKTALPGEAEYLAAFARSYVPDAPWRTDRELLITAIDAETGAFHAWNSQSEIPLQLAVAASCAVPCLYPLVHIAGRAYMDGGMGSPTNADLAAGCPAAIILDPLGPMLGTSAPVEKERRRLEAANTRTLAFTPDRSVTSVIGGKYLDPTRRSEVARFGREQGLETAAGAWKFVNS